MDDKCPCKECFFGYICKDGKSVWCEISECRFDIHNDGYCGRFEGQTEERTEERMKR